MISIITINYNNIIGLNKTIKSVICQTYQDFEYIVIDGSSSDGSLDVINKYQEKIDVWISEKDTGIYNAMNKGIALSKGDYLLFLNSGDIFSSPKSLENVVKYNWTADIVACGIFWDFGKKIKTYIAQPRIVNFQRLLTESISHQSTFIKRSLLVNKGYNENYRIISDWIFWFEEIIIKKATYEHIDVPITIYDMKGISNNNSVLNNNERKEYLSKYINHSILETLISQCEWYDGIEAMRTLNGIRAFVIYWVKKTFFIYWKIIQPFINLYYNIRYCKNNYDS